MEIASPGYRLIFIDIDGVLNRDRRGSVDEPFVHELMERFAELVRATGATLVLSSAWRLTKQGREGARQAFLTYGLPPILSCTPRMHGPRGSEVLYWLQQNTLNVLQDEAIEHKHRLLHDPGQFSEKHYVLPVSIKVAQYVVIDDRDFRTRMHGGYYRKLMTEYGHYVHIDCDRGISRENAELAAELLLQDMQTEPEIMRVEEKESRQQQSPSPVKGYCQYCEKRVKHGIRETPQSPHLYCNPDCLYRYRGGLRNSLM
jgi:hypothetical protein